MDFSVSGPGEDRATGAGGRRLPLYLHLPEAAAADEAPGAAAADEAPLGQQLLMKPPGTAAADEAPGTAAADEAPGAAAADEAPPDWTSREGGRVPSWPTSLPSSSPSYSPPPPPAVFNFTFSSRHLLEAAAADEAPGAVVADFSTFIFAFILSAAAVRLLYLLLYRDFLHLHGKSTTPSVSYTGSPVPVSTVLRPAFLVEHNSTRPWSRA